MVVIFICTQTNKYLDGPIKKESRRNCCNSPAACRVPKNADSICEQSNREAPGTQEKIISEFQNQEVPYANAIFCYDLKPIPLAVYSYLVCCAGQKDVCWPSMKTIALHCGCSENAARDAVSLLADRGFIRKVKTSRCVKSGKWLQGNNHYYILPLPDLPAADHRWWGSV